MVIHYNRSYATNYLLMALDFVHDNIILCLVHWYSLHLHLTHWYLTVIECVHERRVHERP